MKTKSGHALALCAHALLIGVMIGQASAQTLTHRYSFNDAVGSTTFTDSIGGANWNGTTVGTASLDGKMLLLDGNGWATIPAGIIGGVSNLTVEFWASFDASNPVWTRVFAFGDQNGNGAKVTGLDYCHYAGGDWQNLGITGGGADVWINNPGGLNGMTNVHVTVIVDPTTQQVYYYNGTRVASNPGINNGAAPALSTINDTLCLLGKSLYDVDPALIGSINEFRVYQGVVPASAVALNDAAGPDNYITSPGTLQAIHLTTPNNPLVVNQTSQQILTGDFANVTNLNLILYGGATFTSGNPAILTVSSSGLVTAVTPGTTTLVASYGGQSVTNTITVQSIPAVLTHRYSFTSDAHDSVGTAHGTLQGAAVISGGKVVLDGTPGTYVDLPGDSINIATNRAITIETWVDFGDVPNWCRLFDFGADGGSTELYATPRGPGNGGEHWVSGNFSGGQTIAYTGPWSNQTAHLTFVVDPSSSFMATYKNGVLERAVYNATASLSLISTQLAVLGRSLVGVDPYMPGSIDEFRIYNGALSPQEIALSEVNGPNSTAHDPGALLSVKVPASSYPAYSGVVAPIILANYVNLTNFNLLPNRSATVAGLVLTSSDTNVLEVLGNNMLRTRRPGMVTLTANYLGHTDSATVSVKNLAALTHRYSFTSEPNDSVGAANGLLQGTAAVSGGSLVLDGNPGSYLELPPGLLQGYDAVTVDTWVTFNAAQTWARLWYFGNDRADEFYVAPSVNGGSAHWFSTGFPNNDGTTITIPPPWENQTLHVTCIYGNGTMEYYTNGVLHGAAQNVPGSLDEAGAWFSWIGKSPYPDPYFNGSIDEFRIYRGRLAPDEIQAVDVIGPDALTTTTATLSVSRSGSNVTLNWPVAAAGFSVQATSSLGGGWTTLTNAPVLNGSNWQVTLPTSGGTQFFRVWR